MRIGFSEIDFYSLLDSDTDEARTFTTYLGYWVCLGERVQTRYGHDPAPALLAELQGRKAFRRLPGQGKPANPQTLRALLLNGWTAELRLNLIDLEDAKRLSVANHGAPVDAYYASSRHATAWLALRDGSAPTTHRGLLNAMSAQVTGSRLLPPPWDLSCLALKPNSVYGGFATAPGPCSNLAGATDLDARAGMLLRTTRERGVKQKVTEVKHGLKLHRAPNGEAQRQDAKLAATTTFDFTWRMRARSNYGDPAMFYVGSLGPQRAQAYAAAVRSWTSATMFLFEAMIAQRGRAVMQEAAVHFISRDRSGLAAALIVPRLRTLGLLDADDQAT